MGMIAAAILAAGQSTRMGSVKQLLPLWGKPMLQHTISHIEASRADYIVLVLGYKARDIEKGLELRRTRVIYNHDYARGMSSSIRAAVKSLPEEVEAVVFVLGDQPLVKPSTIDRLIQAYLSQSGGARIFIPVYRGRRGNPVLIHRSLFPLLLGLEGDRGARNLIDENPELVSEVEVEDPGVLIDVDTFDDYKALRDTSSSREPQVG